MAQNQISIEPQTLLAAILENLNIQFFADSRDEAKLLFKAIQGDDIVPFMHMAVRSGGEVHCNLTLDSSAYVGKLNFGKFRKILASMMMGISQRLENKEELNILNSDEGDLLYNIPGIVQDEDGLNILVCGLSQGLPGRASINLMFLDPTQYTQAAEA